MADAGALVVKIGGGLLRRDGLDGLRRGCDDAAALARTRPVLVVPGGGPFADAVRDVDARAGLGDRLAHRLALAAMDQLGQLLAALLPDATQPLAELPPEGLESLRRALCPAAIGLLLAAPAFADRPEIPESWDVTSDSLAVYAAAAIGGREALLLKPVAGVFERWPPAGPPVAKLTAAALRDLQRRGCGRAVDRHLPDAIDRTGVTVVVREPHAPTGPDRPHEPGRGTVITPT